MGENGDQTLASKLWLYLILKYVYISFKSNMQTYADGYASELQNTWV